MNFFVSGTDTSVGKSVVAAWLLQRLGGEYWKPVQSGLQGESDTAAVARLSGFGLERFHPETYRLTAPLSPHESARRDGISISLKAFRQPKCVRPLVVEGAGGVLVPLNDKYTMVDLMVQLALPVILVARTGLGTINHTLLSLEALRSRKLTVAGVIFSGPSNPDNRQAIESYGGVSILAEIPFLDPLNADALRAIPPLANIPIK